MYLIFVSNIVQIYEKIDCQGTTDADDARFEFFTKQVLSFTSF